MKIDIICPLYNAENYVINLQNSIEKQLKYTDIQNIRYIITKGKDNTEEIVKKLSNENERILYKTIDYKDFSHSITRQKEVYESTADIIVFISQDIKIEKENWLEELVKPIETNEVEATYSRQTCNNKNSIEYYTRPQNYPSESTIKTKADIEFLGINTFFYSDASSAIKREIFEKLGGYDNKDFPTNEDMYMAYKLITNDYQIKYCAESVVEHSHNFSFIETFKRYKSYGQFLSQEPQINIKSNKAGGKLAKYIITEAIKDRNTKVIFKFLPDMVCRYIGMKVGEKFGTK